MKTLVTATPILMMVGIGIQWIKSTLRRQERFNELWDETQNHVDLYTFSIYDTSDGMQEMSAEGKLEHYYIANQRWFQN